MSCAKVIVAVLLGLSGFLLVRGETTSAILEQQWNSGFKMNIRLQLLEKVTGGWTMTLRFTKPAPGLQIWRAKIVSVSNDKKVYQLKNMPWNRNLPKCKVFELALLADKKHKNRPAPAATVEFKRKKGGNTNLNEAACATTAPPTTEPSAPSTATSTPKPKTTTTSAPPSTPKPTTAPPPSSTSLPSTTTKPTVSTTPFTLGPLVGGQTTNAAIVNEWHNGFKMIFRFLIQEPVSEGWIIKINFTKPVHNFQIWRAETVSVSTDKKTYFVKNMSYNKAIAKCTVLEIDFMAEKEVVNDAAPQAKVTFYRNGHPVPTSDSTICAKTTTTNSPSTASPSTRATTKPVPSTAPPPSSSQPPTDQTTMFPPTTVRRTTTSEPTESPVTTSKPTTSPVTSPVTSTESPVTTSKPTTSPVTSTSTTTHSTTSPSPYDYNKVLHASILFYEAQRSGKLPTTNRIPWRGDSALSDRGDNGEDLIGGWYDAGDFVKFGFPMASSATVLAWGLVEYRDAYKAAGELDAALDSIKWATDYFIKAHTAKFEFYGQVGDGDVDHAYWGRPEDMTMRRPGFKITTSKPGSELAAETAAALAAASIAFAQTKQSYASKLVKHAEELYEFADKYRGKYSDSIPNAASFYKSYSGFNDELVWGAAWLYQATKKQAYLHKAEQYYTQYGMNSKPWAFSWDDKKAGAQVLLAEITGKASYKKDVQTFLDSWLPGGDVHYTPKGLAWRAKWGPNRYSANTAFLALVAAKSGLKQQTYRDFARKQIHYMLGDSGRSFVVGFGANPPLRPHHASSSCLSKPAACTWNDFKNPAPNPQTLTGALVGGPDKNDHYEDKRSDYIQNEVTTDYNAGFQSAVAGLKDLEIVA